MNIDFLIPKTKVFALVHWSSDKNSEEHAYTAIFQATILDAVITVSEGDKINIEYWLRDLNGKDWGDGIEAKYVSEDFESLLTIAKETWLKFS